MIRTFYLDQPMSMHQFSIDENLSALYMTFEVSPSISSWLYINVYHEIEGLIGQVVFGYNWTHGFGISQNLTTMNGKSHNLRSGQYTLVALSSAEGEGGLSLDLTVNILINQDAVQALQVLPEDFMQTVSWAEHISRITSYKTRYYRGDFHGHTHYSDGDRSVEEAINAVESYGLDFMAFTEHNILPFGFKQTDVFIWPSYELTLPKGHVNLHGVADVNIFDGVTSLNEESFINLIQRHHRVGHVSINHPFMAPWDFQYYSLPMHLIHSIEVICDPTYSTAPQANRKALSFLDFLWVSGWPVNGIGGSDSHHKADTLYDGSTLPSVYGDPSTFVKCAELSASGILEGLKTRDVFVTRFITLEFDLMVGKTFVQPGAIVELVDDFHLSLNIANLSDAMIEQPLVAVIYVNGRVCNRTAIEIGFEGIKLCLLKSQFDAFKSDCGAVVLRVSIETCQGEVYGTLNPIGMNLPLPEHVTYGDLKEAFEADD